MTKIYEELARLLIARENCARTNNDEWFKKHSEKINSIVRNQLPSGSGWDSGTKLDMERSTVDKLVFYGGYHHMNDGGYYDGWTEHTVTVRPSLAFGLNITISGRNRNDIKDCLHEMFDYALRQEVKETDNG